MNIKLEVGQQLWYPNIGLMKKTPITIVVISQDRQQVTYYNEFGMTPGSETTSMTSINSSFYVSEEECPDPHLYDDEVSDPFGGMPFEFGDQ